LVDSIQTLFQREMDSAPGTVAQIRQVAGEFMQYAKQYQVPVILVGHVTKDGSLAGPKVLEHLVDTVLQFEGDRHQAYRLLRSLKNRYGATHELGIYQMEREGLREVLNPSDLLMSRHWQNRSGIAIGSTREGNRSLMVEVQALVSPANYGGAQRNTTGFEQRRLQMLLAVLQKRCRLPLAQQDVFLNLAGGLETSDPALDFAVCAAMVSSYLDLPLSNRVCFMAEIGLGGELRPVAGLDARLAEARKLGFDKVVVSSHQGLEPGMESGNPSSGRQTKGLRVIPMDYISDWTATLRGVQPPSTESSPQT
jgi:DNA repair protein RadA/Sms